MLPAWRCYRWGVGFGYGGSQIALMLVLMPLGGAAYALGRWAFGAATRVWLPIAALVGVAAAGPLLFFLDDSFVALGTTEIGLVLRSALFAQVIGALAGLVLLGLSARLRAGPGRIAGLGALAGSLALALALYFAGGHPGWYGEKLFVVLREQADLSQAAQIADRTERLRFVYTTLTNHAQRSQVGARRARSARPGLPAVLPGKRDLRLTVARWCAPTWPACPKFTASSTARSCARCRCRPRPARASRCRPMVRHRQCDCDRRRPRVG